MFLVTNYKVSSDLNQYVHVEFQEKNEIRIGDFVIHQWSKNSWFYTKDEYFYKNDDASEAFIFQGYAWYQDVKLSAQRFYELLKSKSFDVKSLKKEVLGEYSVVYVSPDRVLSFNDLLGIENVYYLSEGKNLLITNRMSFLEGCDVKKSYDFEGGLWMVGLGYMFNEHTLYNELKCLEQNCVIDYKGSSKKAG